MGVLGSSPGKKIEFLSYPEWISCNFSAIFYYIFQLKGLLLWGHSILLGGNIGAGGGLCPPSIYVKKGPALKTKLQRLRNIVRS